jgi:hypothetical protein
MEMKALQAIPNDKGIVSNRNAIIAFVIAKIFGFTGLCLAYSTHRALSFTLLILDALLLGFAVYCCIKIMLQVKDEYEDKSKLLSDHDLKPTRSFMIEEDWLDIKNEIN